jgi:hypothetical protein
MERERKMRGVGRQPLVFVAGTRPGTLRLRGRKKMRSGQVRSVAHQPTHYKQHLLRGARNAQGAAVGDAREGGGREGGGANKAAAVAQLTGIQRFKEPGGQGSQGMKNLSDPRYTIR